MADNATRQMTVGEYKVGLDFNPSANPVVTDLKTKAAAFIDAVSGMKFADEQTEQQASEINRLKALAITHAEDAAMWAVKAATKRPR